MQHLLVSASHGAGARRQGWVGQLGAPPFPSLPYNEKQVCLLTNTGYILPPGQNDPNTVLQVHKEDALFAKQF